MVSELSIFFLVFTPPPPPPHTPPPPDGQFLFFTNFLWKNDFQNCSHVKNERDFWQKQLLFLMWRRVTNV